MTKSLASYVDLEQLLVLAVLAHVFVDLQDDAHIQPAFALTLAAGLEAFHLFDEYLNEKVATLGLLKETCRNLVSSLGSLLCDLEKKMSIMSSEEWSI